MTKAKKSVTAKADTQKMVTVYQIIEGEKIRYTLNENFAIDESLKLNCDWHKGEITEKDFEVLKTSFEFEDFVTTTEPDASIQPEQMQEPQAESENVPIIEFLELKKSVQELSNLVKVLSTENENLKSKKPLTLEEAKKLFDRKNFLESSINQLSATFEELKKIYKTDLKGTADFDDVNYKVQIIPDGYNPKPIASFSKKMLVVEFVIFINGKISERINDLRHELDEINAL